MTDACACAQCNAAWSGSDADLASAWAGHGDAAELDGVDVVDDLHDEDFGEAEEEDFDVDGDLDDAFGDENDFGDDDDIDDEDFDDDDFDDDDFDDEDVDDEDFDDDDLDDEDFVDEDLDEEDFDDDDLHDEDFDDDDLDDDDLHDEDFDDDDLEFGDESLYAGVFAEDAPAGMGADSRRIAPAGDQCRNIRKVVVLEDPGGKTPFSNADFRKLCTAARIADGMAREAVRVFDHIWKQRRTKRKKDAWESNATIVRFLGKDYLTRQQIRVTRRRIHRLARRLRKLTYVIVQRQTGDSSRLCGDEPRRRAYALLRRRRGVYVCPEFFKIESPRGAAKVIVHEAVHLIGWNHATLDGKEVKGRDRSLSLASRRPSKARRNPDNLAYVVVELTCGEESYRCP